MKIPRGITKESSMKIKDVDLNEIKKIVDKHGDKDDIFYKRYYKGGKQHLRMKFWENHFEWNDVKSCFPEINGHIIDFGCGSGHSDVFLASHGYKIHGIDYSRSAIDIAKYLAKIQEPNVRKNLSFEVLNLQGKLKERDYKYDSVWSSHTFEHIVDPSDIFKDLNTLTKPGAKMLISVPFADCYPHPTHVHYWYSEKEFEDFLGQFVNVDKVIKRKPVLRAVVVLDK